MADQRLKFGAMVVWRPRIGGRTFAPVDAYVVGVFPSGLVEIVLDLGDNKYEARYVKPDELHHLIPEHREDSH